MQQVSGNMSQRIARITAPVIQTTQPYALRSQVIYQPLPPVPPNPPPRQPLSLQLASLPTPLCLCQCDT